MTGIPINPVRIDQGGFIPGGAPPDFWSSVLATLPMGAEAGVTGYKEQQQNSRSSAEMDVRKQELALQQQHFKFLQSQEETKQADLAHKQTIADAQGKATLEFLRNLLPHAVATGQAQGMMQPSAAPQPTDQYGLPQGLPFQQAVPSLSGLPQQQSAMPLQPSARPPAAPNDTSHADPFEAIASVLPNMPPEAVLGMVQHLEPILSMLERKNGSLGSAVQTGKGVTTFVPGKGFFDPTANNGQGGYVPYVTRGVNADEEADRKANRQLRDEQIAAAQAQREEIEGRTLTTQFNQRTKTLRDRGQALQQAALTIQGAGGDPVLTSSAIANFVQAADQKAQLRYQMLQYFKKNIDPSFVGGLTNAASLIMTGKYPPQTIAKLASHIQNLNNQARSEFQTQRDAEVKRHPNLAGWLPEADEFFSSDATPAPTSSGPPPVP